MRIVLQKVCEAYVISNGLETGRIKKGYVLLVGIEDADDDTDIQWLVDKICALRVFPDEEGKMNLSIKDVDGDILLISQFTLHASVKKGNRPSFIKAARPETAIPLYEKTINSFEHQMNKKIQTGIFGADMKVHLINDGPVTILLDSKNRE